MFNFFKRDLGESVFVACVLIVFLCCSLIHLSLPGLGRDEVIKPFVALNLLIESDFSLSKVVHNFSFSEFMQDPYNSSFPVLLYVLIFYFFGISIYIIRFVSIFFGLVFLLFFYFFVRSFLNKRIAMFSLALIATLPSLIFYIKTNISFHFSFIFLFGCLLFFWEFYQKKKLRDLSIGCLFLGAGFSYTLIFWWFCFAFIIAFFLLKRSFRFKKNELIIGFLFFIIGASPMILWNLTVPSECNTISYISQHMQGNMPFLKSMPFIKSGIFQFDPVTCQSIVREESRINLWNSLIIRFNQVHSIFKNMFSWWFFLIAFSFSSVTIGFNIIKKEQKKFLFILIIILTIFFESIILSWSLSRHHILSLIPFCIILSANLLNYLYKYSKILVYFLWGLIVVSNFLLFVGSYDNFISGLYYNPVLSHPGVDAPLDFPSGNIYHLAEYLQENKIYTPMSINKQGRECNLNLAFLTSLKVRPNNLIEMVKYNESAFVDALKKELVSQDKMFIIPYAGVSSDIVNLTENIIKDLNKTIVINKTFYMDNGDLEYLLFQVSNTI